MAAESIAAESIAAELEPLGSGVNELAENEFGDSDLAENSVVDSAVDSAGVVKLGMFAGRVEVIGGVRARPWFRARRQPASG